MNRHHWTAAIFAVAGIFASASAIAAPTASQLNRMFSACQTGDYSSCTAYNAAVFGIYQSQQQVQVIQPASASTLDPAVPAARQPSANQTVATPALAQTNQ